MPRGQWPQRGLALAGDGDQPPAHSLEILQTTAASASLIRERPLRKASRVWVGGSLEVPLAVYDRDRGEIAVLAAKGTCKGYECCD